ncbi:MAG: M20 family metallo-hydrolase [Prolixibacteraceae bacterium]|nr:M20 family metallo-hydrolase [Prolixibacteraceae bacterium]
MEKYIELLKTLISTPSLSEEEENAAIVIREFLTNEKILFKTKKNNTWAYNKYFSSDKPTILLNSHIDTVQPSSGYTNDPFTPIEKGDKLYGLGSNDAGGPLISLLALFVHFHNHENLPFNLIFAATAEEEISGDMGLDIVIPDLPPVAFAIVGEPTKMEIAVAEKGLVVLDCYAHGRSGHAARNEGENALYKAIKDIQILQNYKFEKKSELLGNVKLTVTQIEAGTQHNVIPELCHFVVDIRTNEHYPNTETVKIIGDLIESEVIPRSLKLNSSGIPADHPVILKAKEMGIPFYGSPTTSDQAIMPFPSVKMGPGDSSRSHTADEFIFKSEIYSGIETYIQLLKDLIV